MDRAELTGWLRLTQTPAVGSDAARRLLACFGPPEAIFRQDQTALRQVVNQGQAAALADMPEGLDRLVDTTWAWLWPDALPPSPLRQVVFLGDPRYPPGLLATEDPPLVLYYLGGPGADADHAQRHDWFDRSFSHSIAIVGSRNPTPQGLINARQFGQALADAGLTVVSGMALGVDGAAHEGALEGCRLHGSQAATIAVVGTGLDRVYPKAHLGLARRVAKQGLVISEYPIGTPALPANFPRRNRLIAGIAHGTLVVEAALQSGSLITARLTVEQGKDVFAIPGSIHATQSRGCHALIKQGAKLVESAQDVLEEGGWEAAPRPTGPACLQTPAAAPEQDSLLAALGFDPVSLEALLARTGLATAQLQAQLMALELQGQVARLPGGLYQRMASA
jgi:DNA processing protein